MIGHLPRLALALGLFLSQPAQAAPDLKTMHGVWRGMIGNLPVHVCYGASEYSNDGKYFYMRRLSTIPLRADEKVAGELTEGWADTKGVARWRMKAIAKNRAEGIWTGNGRTLPIRLTRLPFATSEEFDSPCGSLAFVQPIVAATRIVKSPRRVHGLAVEKWTLAFPDENVSVESFQLLGTGPAIAAINRRLREPFDKSDEGWKWCLRNAGAWGGDYHDEVEARLVTAHWLSVMSYNESFCGGAHPNNSNQPILFDRQSGRSVDLYTWFGSASSNREKVEGYSETIDTLTGKLFNLVLTLHPRASESEEDCGGAVKTASSWTLELKREGIGFTPDLPRVVMACGDEVVLPWNKLAPFLSRSGKREVAALRAELRR
ncbi:MAG TPA: hypothetical protein VK485_00565 [Sphingomicrobium sp.]|nr:hypothetical protein [Sphingomicrobium sp.]